MIQPSSLSKMFLGVIVVILMSSTVVTQYYAFGQFSTTLEEPPREPTTTSAVSQNNTGTTVEDEGPAINSITFQDDGTGWLTLNNSGTLTAVIKFNHTLTAENGYTVDYRVPYYTNNGTQVDLNDIDFSSQVTLDPNANVTLPGKPKILLQYPSQAPASLPSPSASPPPPPPTTQQPAQTTPPPPGGVIQLQPETSALSILEPNIKESAAARAGLSQTEIAADQTLVNYNAIYDQCVQAATNLLGSSAGISLIQCQTSLTEAQQMYCGISAFDVKKCEYTTMLYEAIDRYAMTVSSLLS